MIVVNTRAKVKKKIYIKDLYPLRRCIGDSTTPHHLPSPSIVINLYLDLYKETISYKQLRDKFLCVIIAEQLSVSYSNREFTPLTTYSNQFRAECNLGYDMHNRHEIRRNLNVTRNWKRHGVNHTLRPFCW